jgi:prepilin-type N-terminal cleavage/methylation domain-containing protein
MTKRVVKVRHKSRRAFTLVELIVVLVILAVVAAMLVPALIGYIDRTRKEKYYNNAHYALVASQAVMTELYGLGSDYVDHTTSDNHNINWSDKDSSGVKPNDDPTSKAWGDKVLALMDRGRGDEGNEPYIFVFGVGHRSEKAGLTLNEQYTVYYIAYVENEDAPAVFYVNGEWMYKYPRNLNNNGKVIKTWKDFRNTIVKDGACIPLQFYVVSNRTKLKDTEFWTKRSGNTPDPRSLLGHSDGVAD